MSLKKSYQGDVAKVMINSFCWSRSSSGSAYGSRHRSGAWFGDWSISLLQIGQKIISRSWE